MNFFFEISSEVKKINFENFNFKFFQNANVKKILLLYCSIVLWATPIRLRNLKKFTWGCHIMQTGDTIVPLSTGTYLRTPNTGEHIQLNCMCLYLCLHVTLLTKADESNFFQNANVKKILCSIVLHTHYHVSTSQLCQC